MSPLGPYHLMESFMSQTHPAATLRAFLEALASLPARGTPTWRELRRAAPLTVTALVTSACGGTTLESGNGGEGDCRDDDCAAECRDGTDNDGDGAIDCEDEDCSDLASCATGSSGGTGGAPPSTGGTPVYGVPYESDCDDGVDNDRDGRADCDDADCHCGSGGAATGGVGGHSTGGLGALYGIPIGGGGVAETGGFAPIGGELTGGAPPSGGRSTTGGVPSGGYNAGGVYAAPFEYDCEDGNDEDGDGRADCADPDCVDDPACVGAGGAGGLATGGVGQGGVYGIPWNLAGAPPNAGQGSGGAAGAHGIPSYPIETTCDDGVDNDGDGSTDCADCDCYLESSCGTPDYASPLENCSALGDEDCDGVANCDDADCWSSEACMDVLLYAAPMYAAPM
ncbi:MAG: hypothetical protein JW751_03825 [Polyangiaceae bacterium]|nr:hypothetical protein [Polyangiaceae bacterium]